jgi:hypothetical protein
VVAGLRDSAAAWSLLARLGHIPSSWLDAPERRFIHDPGRPTSPRLPTRDPALAPTGPHPSSPDDCALYASDVDALLAAERAARVMAERLEPWGAPPCHRVVWWTIQREFYLGTLTDTRPGVSYAPMFASLALYQSAAAAHDAPPGALFGHADAWADAWRRRAAAGAVIADGPNVRPAATGRPFAELPNPFEPMAVIEANGYAALEWLGATGASRGAIVLVSPAD